MDAQTQAVVDRVEAKLVRMARELAELKAGTRTAHGPRTSLSEGEYIPFLNEAGEERGRIGWQPDGTLEWVVDGGNPPPAPSAPTVAAAPHTLMISWDGALALADGDTEPDPLPADLAHVAVHRSTSTGFTHDATTFVGTIPRAGGILPDAPLDPETTYYYLLVPVTTGGVEGTPSAESSGVPDAIENVPAPGSITETEIADDAITTPKLAALAVTAAKIAAAAIEAGHITAGAVEASKLAAILVLATRIVAGDPAGGRVEIDENGLRKYSESGELQVILEGDDAIFSGTVSGARFTITATGGSLLIDADAAGPYIEMVSAAGPRALMYASDNHAVVELQQNPTGTGGLGGLYVDEDSTVLYLNSPSEAAMRLGSYDDTAALDYSPPNPLSATWSAGTLQGYPRPVTDGGGTVVHYTPSVGMSAPSMTGGRFAQMLLRGQGTGGEWTSAEVTADYVALYSHDADELILSPAGGVRHDAMAYVQVAMLANPANGTPGNSGAWTDFTTGQYQRATIRAGESGRVRVDICFVGLSHATTASTLSVGFRLAAVSGGVSDVPADLSRAAMVRSHGLDVRPTAFLPGVATVYLTLQPGEDYTLIPAWRTSSAASRTWGLYNASGSTAEQARAHYIDLAYQSSITVTPMP